ncbi:MerR family transcriptional regulator [Aureibacillus halotolerans]|uniref:MerR family glutamine synthetase transcriptional repressor n=1 Tax=Aureibacillus halotolerans TaxID=1508390 RepID=A0A4R6U2Y1_9BACI|nr:MerR family transcriptional regulator [Aureibacillus halotolerans]TDQ39732.1 MerR family glutamine synthetase transcriptional repressor [Aureibacillus halotolerans]
MNDTVRRSMALFPISIVKKLTELTARQIRYYEEHDLVHPERTEGNRRLFSFNDVDRLLEIKALIEQGINMAGVRRVFDMREQQEKLDKIQATETKATAKDDISDAKLRSMLKKELVQQAGRHNRASLIQGELSRFFH